MARDTYLPVLFQLFRQYGYDGVSLAKIAEATNLGKASLYHHFPGGKAEMLAATLVYSQQWLEDNLFQVLRSDGTAIARFQTMCERLNDLYASGEQPCLIAALVAGAPRDIFQEQVRHRLQAMVDAISAVLIDSGMSPTLASQRGEDAMMIIQGALILSRGLDCCDPFQRAIAQLPQKLCAGLEG